MVRHKKDKFSRGKGPVHGSGQRASQSDEAAAQVDVKPGFRAVCWDLGHCDPKRCSGKRLIKSGLMLELRIGQKFAGVVISYVASFAVVSLQESRS